MNTIQLQIPLLYLVAAGFVLGLLLGAILF
jgi:hypothetical protein